VFRRFCHPIAACALVLLIASSCGAPKSARVRIPRPGESQTGIASWYGPPYHGRPTASGEIYDMDRMTAAHRSLAFGTWLQVRNLDNGKSADVRVNDRGPFVRGRVLDLSRAAARSLAMIGPGTAKVKLTVITPPQDFAGSRFAVQLASFRDRAVAEQLAERLQHDSQPARIQESIVEGRRYFRVLAGSWAERAFAEQQARHWRRDYPDCFVVNLDP